MLSSLRNPHDRIVVKDIEHFSSGGKAQYPMMRPEDVQGKGGPRRQAWKLEGEQLMVGRYIDQLIELERRYGVAERGAEEHKLHGALNLLYRDSTVKDYLTKHPEDASYFGLHQFNIDDPDAGGEQTRKILDQSLIGHLAEKPEIGEHLGDKALGFRIIAAHTNLVSFGDELKDLLSGLPALKKRSENGYPLYARAFFQMKKAAYKSLWWIRDHPFAGGITAIAVLVLAKIVLALLVLDEIEKKVFNMQAKRAEKKAEKLAQERAQQQAPPSYPPIQAQRQPQSQARYRPQAPQPQQNPAYAPQRQRQNYGPDNGPPVQTPVFPAPYFNPQPTPLQTALNMPTA
jgi:hypothetical protein